MYFSCKISNSILGLIEKEGLSKEFLYSGGNWSEEFLKDPSYWLEAQDMENFLRMAEESNDFGFGELITKVGHKAPELNKWGPLDSVLRLMQGPQNIMGQPDRFLSYFISPPPPIGRMDKSQDLLAFELPIADSEFPCTTLYLQSVIEALPAYMGQPLAEASWKKNVVRVNWATDQGALFNREEKGPNINPTLLQNLVSTLEKSQKELEQRNQELLVKNQELSEAQKKLEMYYRERMKSEKLSGLSELATVLSGEIHPPLSQIWSQVTRMQEFFGRAGNVIQNLSQTSEEIKQALKRSEWEYVRKEMAKSSKVVETNLQKVKDIFQDISVWLAGDSEKISTDLNQVILNALDMVEPVVPEGVRIDKYLFMDRPVAVFPRRLEQALVQLLYNSIHSISKEGTIRITATPLKGKAEIEISDTGSGMDDHALKRVFTPFYSNSEGRSPALGLSIAQSIIQMHNGRIQVESSPGRGSTFKIELPTGSPP